MADRPTQEIRTSGGHVVVLNTYITGGENWQIRQLYMNAMRDKANGSEISKDIDIEAEKLAFQTVLVSLDGDAANVVARVFDLPLAEFQEVTQAVKNVTDAKKKSETT